MMQKVGTIEWVRPELVGFRDAFHVPAILVAIPEGVVLGSGDRVRFVDNWTRVVPLLPSKQGDWEGIIDPLLYLPGYIQLPVGCMVWVWLNPDKVHTLQHRFYMNGEPLAKEPTVAAAVVETLESELAEAEVKLAEMQQLYNSVKEERDAFENELEADECRGCYS